MSMRINHNTSALNAHRNLQTNQMELSRTLEKLSSGLKINRAAEGPAALVISEQMRAQLAKGSPVHWLLITSTYQPPAPGV